MRYLPFVFALFFFTVQSPAQTIKHESKGRALVQQAYAYQNKLLDSTATIDQVIHRWSVTAANPSVKKDPDAQAIAYGCEGLLEIQKNDAHKADSLLKRALPLFRLRESKAPILVSYAEFERGIHHYADAMRADEEIVKTMDSIPQLDDIPYYHASGYAPYAYAIDASFAMTNMAKTDTSERKKAVELLTETLKRHPQDALGIMDITGLHELHAISEQEFKFKIDYICSVEPNLRPVADLFQQKFSNLQ